MIDPYLALKWLHLVSAAVLFGTGLGTALHMWLAHLSGDLRAIAVVARNVVRADWWFTAPSAVAQPLSGLALVHLAGYDPFESWLVAAYALYAVAAICWLVVVRLQIEARDLAVAAACDGTALPPAYHRAMRAWFALGWPAFVALLATFWLMVAKPAIW